MCDTCSSDKAFSHEDAVQPSDCSRGYRMMQDDLLSEMSLTKVIPVVQMKRLKEADDLVQWYFGMGRTFEQVFEFFSVLLQLPVFHYHKPSVDLNTSVCCSNVL